MGIAGEMRNNKIVLYVLILLFFISGVSFGKDEYSHEIAPLVANSAPPILTDEHHLIA